MVLCQVIHGYPRVCPMGLMLSGKDCTFKATSDRCFHRHLVVMHATCRSVYCRGSEARESFTPLSIQDYDCQHISITNRQGGRSEHRVCLLCEAGVPIDTPDLATVSRKAKAPVVPVSPTMRWLLGRWLSGTSTASHSSAFVATSSRPRSIQCRYLPT